MNLSELYQAVADARVDLGHAEDFVACCCPKDKHRARRQLRWAQNKLDSALEELNCRLVQLGRGLISSRRSIHIID